MVRTGEDKIGYSQGCREGNLVTKSEARTQRMGPKLETAEPGIRGTLVMIGREQAKVTLGSGFYKEP
jgi:hypothetical protein